jgi:hypothetical protein
MAELDFKQAAQWLNLTPQQLDILYCVFRLQEKKLQTTPKNIQAEYRALTGKYLMKPNLFNILRTLKASKTLKQANYGTYGIDIEGIRDTFGRRGEEYRQRLEEFEGLSGEIEGFFMKLQETNRPPNVEYLEYAPFFNKITSDIRRAKCYYATAKFPSIISTISRYSEPGRGSYLKTLSQKCFEDQSLEVNYLTGLDLDNPYNHALRFYADEHKAYDECVAILSRLEKRLKTHKNLHVYYLMNPYGMDILLPEHNKPENLYMFIRDSRLNVTGGLRIQSRDIAARAKETFMTLCQQATALEGVAAKRIIAAKRKELRERYG